MGYERNVKPPSTKRSRIYFIQSGCPNGFIKIGIAIDPLKRLADLQTASPYKLMLLHDEPGDQSDEQNLHMYFHEHHHRGEWFRPCDELLEMAGVKKRERITERRREAETRKNPKPYMLRPEEAVVVMEACAEMVKRGQKLPPNAMQGIGTR